MTASVYVYLILPEKLPNMQVGVQAREAIAEQLYKMKVTTRRGLDTKSLALRGAFAMLQNLYVDRIERIERIKRIKRIESFNSRQPMV